jgi:poly-gamma-glutamate system protein
VGASNWGATDPDFTWLDMEQLFESQGIFSFSSLAATHGGGDDMGRGLSPSGRQKILDAMHRNEVPQIASNNLEEAIVKRMALYEEKSRGRLYRAYVNVGGGLTSIGSSQNRSLIPPGLSYDLGPKNWPRKGCLILMSEKGIPVIQLLSMADLAAAAGLPFAPESLPEPGEGEVFVKDSYRLSLAFLFFLVYSGLCVFVLAPEIRQGVFDRVRGKVDGDAI